MFIIDLNLILSTNFLISFNYDIKLLLHLIVIIILIEPCGLIIRKILNNLFKNSLEEDANEVRVGKYIGYIERVMIYLLCISGSIGTIGFVLAAKTVARYPDISSDNDNFREKYILGTMLSCAISIFLYYLITLVY